MSLLQRVTKVLIQRSLKADQLSNLYKNTVQENLLTEAVTIATKANNNIIQNYIRRFIWGYVAIAFNKVDIDRLSKVGPNRLCAEWVIKNGGGVRFTNNPSKLWRDYNALPPETSNLRIKVVDASNASIMKIGLEHFKGCNDIDTVIFHNCKHLENDSLDHLMYLEASLQRLQVSGCYNFNDKDLMPIGNLKNLRQLLLFDMIYVKNIKEVQQTLQAKLPNCTIKTTKFSETFQ